VSVNGENLEKMIGDNQELSERIKDKNDLLETKDFKNNEVLNQIDQLHT
jgi:hypothetical protein